MLNSTTKSKQVSSNAGSEISHQLKARHLKADAKFLTRASLLVLGIALLGLLSSFVSLDLKNLHNLVTVILIGLICGVCGLVWLSAYKGQLLLASWLLIITLLGGNTFLFLTGNDSSFIETLGAFIAIALVAMIIIDTKIAYAIVGWSNLATLFIWKTNGIFISKNGGAITYKVGLDDLAIFITLQLLTIWLANYLVEKLVRANQTTEAQAQQLLMALADIERKQQFGEETSQRVFSLSAELHATANQQAGGSKEQVNALTEVITFMQELTQTSRVIAGEATDLKQGTLNISTSSQQAKAASSKVEQVGKNSALAVWRTTEHNQQVNEFYVALRETLEELVQSQDEIKKVVNLIRGLGSQTHLLALNAAIEAAGAGEYGERFGVVARQIKALADRSIVASQEVSHILGAVENRIQKATQVAEGGYQETQAALSVAQDSGTIMNELITIIERNNEEMGRIEHAANLMTGQASEISYATAQQSAASVRGVEQLQVISNIATQTASGSIQVINSTRELENLAQRLLTALR